MLAPASFPAEFIEWNRKNGAPSGRKIPPQLLGFMSSTERSKVASPFKAGPAARTRAFEYPWTYHTARVPDRARILHVGSGDAGFMRYMRSLGHDVEALPTGSREVRSGLAETDSVAPDDFVTEDRPGTFDVAYAISALERVPAETVDTVVDKVRRLLKPHAPFIVTLSLFLNLAPFTTRLHNGHGFNHNVKALIDRGKMDLLHGDTDQLYGFEGCTMDSILERMERFLIGDYPVLKQCFVVRLRQE